MKCFTKGTLLEANDIAKRRNYNRQLETEFIKSLPDNKLFPAFYVMAHEHAAGIKVKTHYRCWVVFDEKGKKGFIDCDARLFQSLIDVAIETPGQKETR